MRLARVLMLAGCSALLPAAAAELRDGGSIHGAIRTTGGEVLEGPIRWGSEASFWDDSLVARKIEAVDEADERDGFRFSLFGFTLVDTGESDRPYHELAVPFGHLRALEPARGGKAVLELKSGAAVEVEASDADLGPGLTLVVDVAGRGEVELPWRRIARVEFTPGPRQSREAERLFGTVTMKSGELTGFLLWDRDEVTGSDVLDGDEDGHDREIPFRDIAAIEPAGSSSARVVLRAGTTVKLSGTNDVNADNRGTVVRVPGLGTVTVHWEDLVRVEFRAAPPSPAYDRFDGGRPIAGAVRATDGGLRRGTIVWDRDERFSWETLDGERNGIDYRIPFALIRSVARADGGGSDVVLRDGRSVHLSATNDVDTGNGGVVVSTGDGTETVVDWTAVRDVEFD